MKKLTAALLAMSMTAGLLAGCGAPEPEETTAADSGSAQLSMSASLQSAHSDASGPYVQSGENITLKVTLSIPPQAGSGNYQAATLSVYLPTEGVTVDAVDSTIVNNWYVTEATSSLTVELETTLIPGRS